MSDKQSKLVRKWKRLRKKRRAQRRPINVLASVLTTLSLSCGVMSILSSISQQYEKAVSLVLLAIMLTSAIATNRPMRRPKAPEVSPASHRSSEHPAALPLFASHRSMSQNPATPSTAAPRSENSISA